MISLPARTCVNVLVKCTGISAFRLSIYTKNSPLPPRSSPVQRTSPSKNISDYVPVPMPAGVCLVLLV